MNSTFGFRAGAVLVILSVCWVMSAAGQGLARIHKAARDGKLVDIRKELNEGVSVDVRTDAMETPLQWAVAAGKLESVELLLARGADPNAMQGGGKTALYFTCSAPIMRALLAAGARPGTTAHPTRWSVVQEALTCPETHETAVVELLLEHGADPRHADEFGMTALHVAAGYGGPGVVDALLKKGADVNAGNVQGLSPLDVAVVTGRQAVADVLAARGGEARRYKSGDDLALARVGRGELGRGIERVLMKSTADTKPGFIRLRYDAFWVGEGGGTVPGLRGRRVVVLSGRWFAEPGHTYTIATYAGAIPRASYGAVVDRDTGAVVGKLIYW